jgi:hypothetical protein
MGRCKITENNINKAISNCLVKSRSRDVISKRLSDYYRIKYNVDSFVLTKGVDPLQCKELQFTKIIQNRKIKIVLGGNLFFPPPWPNDLIAGLDILRHDKNIDIEFHIYSSNNFKSEIKYIFVHEILPEPAYNNILHTMDIGYTCCPLHEAGKEFAISSFPTKIVTYIGAGLPFLYHGPEDSIVGDLLKDYKAGIIVESHEPEKLAKGFLDIINNYQDMKNECYRATRNCFDNDLIRKKFMDAILKITQ